jgi:hypothetical protein
MEYFLIDLWKWKLCYNTHKIGIIASHSFAVYNMYPIEKRILLKELFVTKNKLNILTNLKNKDADIKNACRYILGLDFE